ncbi:hypothetical protein Tco_0718542 [Tanacetum coccineum]
MAEQIDKSLNSLASAASLHIFETKVKWKIAKSPSPYMLCVAHQLSHDMGLLAELPPHCDVYFLVHLQLLQESKYASGNTVHHYCHINFSLSPKCFHKARLAYCQTKLIVKPLYSRQKAMNYGIGFYVEIEWLLYSGVQTINGREKPSSIALRLIRGLQSWSFGTQEVQALGEECLVSGPHNGSDMNIHLQTNSEPFFGFVEPHLGWLSVVAGVFTLNQLNTGQVDELQNTIEEDQKSMIEEMRMAIYENKSIVEDAAGSSEAMAID